MEDYDPSEDEDGGEEDFDEENFSDSGSDLLEIGSDDDQSLGNGFSTKKRRLSEDENSVSKSAKMCSSEHSAVPALPLSEPVNFSRIKTTQIPILKDDKQLREQELQERFPLYVEKAAPSALEITVKAGEMLFLPAGWFHEVFSTGSAHGDMSHMAFNYWFHPPDALNFEHPYTSSFWRDDWNCRLAENKLS
jgi:hypothetical protein